ncbi:hypothetical protein HHK36_017655 [Tetracentron sinense]|uniref:Homeobox domain-containing protein n=1 Tax=Tetracentron sinense TaxID=13715 RepID=A0A835DA40_TETSI|nr:hypothetical protein HHK36_017655 [Tetracentron sinense]
MDVETRHEEDQVGRLAVCLHQKLGLSLGDAPKPFTFLETTKKINNNSLGFCMNFGVGINGREEDIDKRVSADPPVQLDLLPLAPVPRNPPSTRLGLPWPNENGSSEGGSSGQLGGHARGFDVNRLPSATEVDDGTAVSSPNSIVSSFQMDFSRYRSGTGGGNKRDAEAAANEIDTERASSRASDEDENGLTRKKLRLSKEQSAFLEDSFKEHNTLNPKQKVALAKQLNLRPRQIEVWFQNRRARTKLKQTEVDCEYLKGCCETLKEENRRLQKELQDLRALKASHPFYMQLPATTLTMCPSCERVATASTTDPKTIPFSLTKPNLSPFSHAHQSA